MCEQMCVSVDVNVWVLLFVLGMAARRIRIV